MKLNHKKQIDLLLGGVAVFLLKPLVIIMGRLLRRPHDLQLNGRILVMKLVGGGSLVLAYPALLALKEKMQGQGELSIVTTPSVAPFARELKLFDHIHVIEDRSFLALVFSTLRFLCSQIFRVDTCIDLEIHSRGTAILSLLTMAHNRLGFYKETVYWRMNLYTHLVFYNTYSCSADFYGSLIALFNVPSKNFDQAAMVFQNEHPVSSPEGEWCLSFACSDHARERQMTPAQWVEALKKVSVPERTRIVLLGSRQDHSQGETLKHEITKQMGLICSNECGEHALSGTVKRMAQTQKFLGIDSGLLHFARLLGKNTVSFWGPTDPGTRLMPRNRGEDILFYNKVSCSPCVHFADTPPCQGKNRCIEAIFNSELAHQQRSWAVLAPQGSQVVEIYNG